MDSKGDLYVNKMLDREQKSSYHLSARMYDGNKKLIEDSGDFIVHVTDINDNMPVFPMTYNGSIMERSMIGEFHYCQMIYLKKICWQVRILSLVLQCEMKRGAESQMGLIKSKKKKYKVYISFSFSPVFYNGLYKTQG